MHFEIKRTPHVILASIALAAVVTTALYVINRTYWQRAVQIGGIRQEPSQTRQGQEKQQTVVTTGPEKTTAGLPPYKGEPITLLNADPKIAAAVGSVLLEKYQKNLEEVKGRLDEHPENYDDWIQVSYVKKLFNNYKGARDALEYAKIVNPKHPLAYFNLGVLYGYELREPVEAEKNYTSALTLNPLALDYYTGLASFYREVLKTPEKGEAVIKEALKKLPQNGANLFAAAGSYYRDERNFGKAIEYFEKALRLASNAGEKKIMEDELKYLRSKQ